jgi:hypothetical protein
MNDAQTDKGTKGGGRVITAVVPRGAIREHRRHCRPNKSQNCWALTKLAPSLQGVHQFYRRHEAVRTGPWNVRQQRFSHATHRAIPRVSCCHPTHSLFKLPNPEHINLNDPSKYEYQSTHYLNPQSKGNLGKSFETEFRTAWLDRPGIA